MKRVPVPPKLDLYNTIAEIKITRKSSLEALNKSDDRVKKEIVEMEKMIKKGNIKLREMVKH